MKVFRVGDIICNDDVHSDYIIYHHTYSSEETEKVLGHYISEVYTYHKKYILIYIQDTRRVVFDIEPSMQHYEHVKVDIMI